MEASFGNLSPWEVQLRISQVATPARLHTKENQLHNMKFLEVIQILNLLMNLFKHGNHFHTTVLEITY